MVIGYLVLHTCYCVRRTGKFGTGERARFRPTYTEYPRGSKIEICSGNLPKSFEHYIRANVVDLFDKDMQPASWDDIKELFVPYKPIVIPGQKNSLSPDELEKLLKTGKQKQTAAK